MDITLDNVEPEETWDDIPEEILNLPTDEIITRTRLIDNDLKVRARSTWRMRSCSCSELGYSIRDTAVAARAERDEGEDSRQQREDQTE